MYLAASCCITLQRTCGITVGGTEPTVDIDRDQPTGRLIGGLVVDNYMCVGTIPHHLWDH